MSGKTDLLNSTYIIDGVQMPLTPGKMLRECLVAPLPEADTEAPALADEREDGTVKVSLRSLSPWDVSVIARKFGGGGHARAAAFSREGRLDEIIPSLRMVIEATMEGNQ